MAKESTSLLRSSVIRKSIFSGCIGISYSQSNFHSKGTLLVLLWALSVLVAQYILIYSFICLPITATHFIIWDGLLITVFLFFPLLGYLGEKYLRYKLLLIGVFMIAISYILNMVLTALILILHSDLQFYLCILYIVALIPSLFGYGLFISNVTQFGASQLQFAPSTDFAAFARWSICIFIFGMTFPQFFIVLFTNTYISNLWLLLPQLFCLLMMIVVTLIVACLSSRHLIIEYPPLYSDPVKLIYQVLRYSWRHKYPARRIAFAYNDGYVSRINLGKSRYGGPFTTDQVENVKTFLRILLILMCHLLIPIFCANTLAEWFMISRNVENSNFLQTLLLKFPSSIGGFVAAACMVIFQYVVIPFFPRLVLGILKRLILGICFHLLAAVLATVIRFNMSTDIIGSSVNYSQIITDNSTNAHEDDSWPYYLITIPSLLVALGLFLNITSQLEFIFAQAPYNMKGILIGLLQLEVGVPMFMDFVGVFTQAADHWEYFLVISILVLISLITCSFAVYFYRYRLGNEPSDINVRSTIEEIYERNLRRMDEESESDK